MYILTRKSVEDFVRATGDPNLIHYMPTEENPNKGQIAAGLNQIDLFMKERGLKEGERLSVNFEKKEPLRIGDAPLKVEFAEMGGWWDLTNGENIYSTMIVIPESPKEVQIDRVYDYRFNYSETPEHWRGMKNVSMLNNFTFDGLRFGLAINTAYNYLLDANQLEELEVPGIREGKKSALENSVDIYFVNQLYDPDSLSIGISKPESKGTSRHIYSMTLNLRLVRKSITDQHLLK